MSTKRKRDDKNRRFNSLWTELYMFIDNGECPLCLICNDTLSLNKITNIRRHFTTKHAAFAVMYPEGEARKNVLEEMLEKYHSGTHSSDYDENFAKKRKDLEKPKPKPTGGLRAATFAGACSIIREGKPFTDMIYVKKCMLKICDELFDDFPNKTEIMEKLENLPGSGKTAHDRTLRMATYIERKQISDLIAAPYFSFAIDVTCDNDKLCIIGRHISGKTVVEEILALLPLKSVMGEEIFSTVMTFMKEKEIPTQNLVALCTDGVPTMVGKYYGFITLFAEKLNRPLLNFHCMAHQEALCAQSCGTDLTDVMELLGRIVKFLVERAVNDEPFKKLMEEVNAEYPEIEMQLNNNIRWLSRGKVLPCFADCLNHIKEYLVSKGVKHPQLWDSNWLVKFYYLVDITEHLNDLNMKIQAKGNSVLSLQQALFAFESKLTLFIKDIEIGRLLHFERLRRYRDQRHQENPYDTIDLLQLHGFVSELLLTFRSRYVDFRNYGVMFKFLIWPHQIAVEELNLTVIPCVSISDFELELIDFKESDIWIDKFVKLNTELENLSRQRAELTRKRNWAGMKLLEREDHLILKTWNEIPVTFKTMQNVALAILSIFGSTYMSEQAFNNISAIKNNLRARINQESLNACLKVVLTNCDLDFKEMGSKMQEQKSH